MDVVAALAPTEVVGGAPAEIRELAYDTRDVRPGTRLDGHDLAADAVCGGAAALVVDHRLDIDAPQFVVPSVRAAMPRAAVEFFGNPSRELDVLGVTGTSGKTTTVFLLHAILAAAGCRPAMLSSIERRVGESVREPT